MRKLRVSKLKEYVQGHGSQVREPRLNAGLFANKVKGVVLICFQAEN